MSGHINGHVKEVPQSEPQVVINFQVTSLPILFLITEMMWRIYSVIQQQLFNPGVQKEAENHFEFLYSKGLECGPMNVIKAEVLENILEYFFYLLWSKIVH